VRPLVREPTVTAGPDQVLADAVAAGVLIRTEADLIAAIRLDEKCSGLRDHSRRTARVFERPAVEKVFHGAATDLELGGERVGRIRFVGARRWGRGCRWWSWMQR
jgi:hypothetical protein